MQPIAAPLLQWFQANKRLLPFRQEPSAYHIWVSEIMLQQTRVAAAIPYYNRFIAALPTPADLAVCEPDALRKLWQGLGYYNRVNNMQKAARIVCEQYGGDLPADYDALRSLPGTDYARPDHAARTLDYRAAWRFTRGAGQRVAVIDTGVTPHPRLGAVIPGGDYVSTGDGRDDCDAHGTAVAGSPATSVVSEATVL